MKNLCIFGAGGFGRECAIWAADTLGNKDSILFAVQQEYKTSEEINGIPVLLPQHVDHTNYRMVIAIGNPATRKEIHSEFKGKFEFGEIIHPRAIAGAKMKDFYGTGTIICPGAILTDNIRLGQHVHINLNATIGHDSVIGDFCTISPGANISGNVTIGSNCFIGTNAAVRENVSICDDVIIGMGAVVLSDISEPGTYLGIPAKKN